MAYDSAVYTEVGYRDEISSIGIAYLAQVWKSSDRGTIIIAAPEWITP
jgi:hypothetical protein